MESITVEIDPHPHHLDVATFRMKGILYASTLSVLEKAFQSLLASSSRNKIVLDLTETIYVSSGGWGLLMSSLERVKKLGGNLVLARLKPEVLDSLELLGFHQTLRSFAQVEIALQEGLQKSASPSSIKAS
jgi:anti-anti-sigma factor